MILSVATVVLLCAAPAAPAGLHLTLQAPELAPRQQQALGNAAQRVLGELTALNVSAPESLPRPCDDAGCLSAKTSEATPLALFVTAAVPSLELELRGALYDAGTGVLIKKTVRGGNPDAPEEAVRTLLDALMPRWSRKGQASIAVRAPDNSVVKVDGRRVALVPLGDALPVSAGTHEVDVVFPDGQAVMFHPRLEEGARFAVAVRPSDALQLVGSRAPRPPALRYTSYALWGAGALAIAGSLVAGGLSQSTARELRGCDIDTRNCLRIDEAQRLERRAQRYAGNANVLLVGGLALSAAGAGVFVFDLAGGD